MASVRLLDAAGVDFTYLGKKENCCGTPMLVAGKWDVFEEMMRQNIQNMKDAGVDTVVTSCPACDMMWRQVYPRWAKKLGIEYGITDQTLQRGDGGKDKPAASSNSRRMVKRHAP